MKSIIVKRFKQITHPKILAKDLLWKYAPYISNDRKYIELKYWLIFGEKCNLENPKTFQEKLQWIKLNDRKEIYHQMVDKYDAKKFISEKVGEEYVIPTLGVWDRFEDIDFDSLPNQFIIKNTYDSGTYFICKDKSKLDTFEVRKRLMIDSRSRKVDYYVFSREWPYKGLKHRIIAEPLIATPETLREYKFFCFNGEPKFYQTCYDRNNDLGGAILNFYDIKGCKIDLQDAWHARHSDVEIPIPTNLQKMVDLAKTFSFCTYFLRVDFFELDDKVYCGEFTFFENGGWCKFTPEKYNRILGDWIKLPFEK